MSLLKHNLNPDTDDNAFVATLAVLALMANALSDDIIHHDQSSQSERFVIFQ